MDEAKPFKIPKREVWEAFKRVKANQGAAGVDGQSIAEFEANLSSNLYKLWNRMSSGSYFPPPVRRVDIPKANGGSAAVGHSDAPGIMHLIQFALGMPGGDDLSSRPNLAAVDRRRRRF